MTSSFGRNLGVTQLRTLKTSRGTERSMGSTQNEKAFAGWERKSWEFQSTPSPRWLNGGVGREKSWKCWDRIPRDASQSWKWGYGGGVVWHREGKVWGYNLRTLKAAGWLLRCQMRPQTRHRQLTLPLGNQHFSPTQWRSSGSSQLFLLPCC